MIYFGKLKHSLIRNLAMIFLVVGGVCLPMFDSYAYDDFGPNRVRACGVDAAGNSVIEGIDPSIIGIDIGGALKDIFTGNFPSLSGAGRDAVFDFSNAYCQGHFWSMYIRIKVNISVMNKVCVSGDVFPRITPSPIQDMVDIIKALRKAKGNAGCIAAISVLAANYASLYAQVRVIHKISSNVYGATRICGANWTLPDTKTYTRNKPGHKVDVENAIAGYINNNQTGNLSWDNINYREYINGGVEVVDNPADGSPVCMDYTKSESGRRQRYYLRGYDIGNFGCEKYNLLPGQADPLYSGIPATAARIAKFQESYNCCRKRSQQYLCIEFQTEVGNGVDEISRALGTDTHVETVRKFCKVGTRCNFSFMGEAAGIGLQAMSDAGSATIGAGADIVNGSIETGVRIGDDGTSASIAETKTGDPAGAVGVGGSAVVAGGVITGGTVVGSLIVVKGAVLKGLAESIKALSSVYFDVYAEENGNLICGKSYSLCPYNFSIGGGSTVCDYFKDGNYDAQNQRWKLIQEGTAWEGSAASKWQNVENSVGDKECAKNSQIRNADCTYNNKANKCANYCQYMQHCTRVGVVNRDHRPELSPYFSDACINFVGDSQNNTSLATGIIAGNARHFSAPIAQCIKETMENLFYNRVGHSMCANATEVPTYGGICRSGTYLVDGAFVYKKGNQAKSQSFFSTVQAMLQGTIRMVMTMAVMFYGVVLLGGVKQIPRKEIVIFIAKMGLIFYFALGNAWQTYFFDGVYNTATQFSRMTFRILQPKQEVKSDGCQFGTVNTQDGFATVKTVYPKGKEYLAIWDTLDCKLARYLGYAPSANLPNIVLFILAGFVTGALGIYFTLAILIFAFFLLSAVIRALHVFLTSCISIIIMVMVSPITITLSMFNRTKGIFDGWVTNLISFVLQPMILFAYIGIMVAMIDKVFVGSATFYGPPPNKIMSCKPICVKDGLVTDSTPSKIGDTLRDNTELQTSNKTLNEAVNAVNFVDAARDYFNRDILTCTKVGERLVDPMEDSIACMLHAKSLGEMPFFSIIGVTLPIITDLFTGNVREKMLTILRAVMLMYILYKFLDQIPSIASSLFGGTSAYRADQSSTNALSMLKDVGGMMRGIQKRASRLTKSAGKAVRDGKTTERLTKAMMDDGKATKDANTSSSATTRSGSGSGSSPDVRGENSGGGAAVKQEDSSPGGDKTGN